MVSQRKKTKTGGKFVCDCFEDDDLATKEELSINAIQQTKHRHLRSSLDRQHHAFGLRAYSIIACS